MIQRKELAGMIEELAPLCGQMLWDNSGFNVSLHDKIEKVLVVLDITMEAIEEAKRLCCDTIVSHHPVLFNAVKTLETNMPVKQEVIEAIRNDMNIYCAHTSYDCAEFGMNYELAERLGLLNTELFIKEENLGRIGEFEKEISAEELISLVKDKLDIGALRTNCIRNRVKRLAIIGGSGGDAFLQAKEMGADALLTGEAKYNQFIDSAEAGIMLLETGHFDSEKTFIDAMRIHLQKRSAVLKYILEVYAYTVQKAPYDYV